MQCSQDYPIDMTMPWNGLAILLVITQGCGYAAVAKKITVILQNKENEIFQRIEGEVLFTSTIG